MLQQNTKKHANANELYQLHTSGKYIYNNRVYVRGHKYVLEKFSPSRYKLYCYINIRKKLLERISSSDVRATRREKDQGVKENWCQLLLEEGYSSEIASIDNKDSPLRGEHERDRT